MNDPFHHVIVVSHNSVVAITESRSTESRSVGIDKCMHIYLSVHFEWFVVFGVPQFFCNVMCTIDWTYVDEQLNIPNTSSFSCKQEGATEVIYVHIRYILDADRIFIAVAKFFVNFHVKTKQSRHCSSAFYIYAAA